MRQLFNVFSRRHTPTEKAPALLTPEFRHRVLQTCTEAFSVHVESWYVYPHSREMHPFWSDIYKNLRLLRGRLLLSNRKATDDAEDLFEYLLRCDDDHFLDFVELIFKSEHVWGVSSSQGSGFVDVAELIGSVNEFFEADDLPFALTDFVLPPPPQRDSSRPLLPSYTSPRIEAYPQVIRRESNVLHEHAMEPVLALLTQPQFKNANKEFLEALEDYRKGRYGDCVTKCGSSLESTMKVICDRNGWQYQQTDTANKLINAIWSNVSLPTFLKQPITLIASARNRLSTSHGGGTQERVVGKHMAHFLMNVTASAILLIVDATE